MITFAIADFSEKSDTPRFFERKRKIIFLKIFSVLFLSHVTLRNKVN
jgi:hypothetical protein